MYKYNRYNYSLKLGGDVVFLNLINKNMITVSEEKFNLIASNSPDDLESKNVHLFSTLKKLGFIVPSKVDEYKIISVEYNKIVFDNSIYRITINPTLNCNFSCWYCYEEHNQGVMNSDTIERVYQHIKNYIEQTNISMFQLDWFGGEPMICFDSVIYPLSKKILKLCSSNNVRFHNQITTNGYLINEDHMEKFREIKLKQFQITLDGDEELHNSVKKGVDSYKKTISNITAICREVPDVNMLVRINYSNDTIDTVKNIIKDFPIDVRKCIQINFQKIWQYKDNNIIDELNKLKKEFSDNGYKILDYSIDHVTTCYADRLNQAVINYDGNIFKCTARDFIKKNSDGYLDEDGDIVWDQTKLSNRMGKQPFDNEKCVECDLLPACYGPCSQKILETEIKDFDKICNYNGIKDTINYIIKKYYDETFN